MAGPVETWPMVDAVLFVTVIIGCILLSSRRKSTIPGPKGFPFIGNIYQVPKDQQWLVFDEWIHRYGDLVQINLLGEPTLIIGSYTAASELLDSRGTIYSDRPPAVMAGELVGWNQGLGYSPGPQSPRFREFRRLFQQFMGPRPSQDHLVLSLQEKFASKLLLKLLESPQYFITHVRQSTGAFILKITYGYDVMEDQREDYLVQIVEKAMQGFALASEPGAFFVDYFPILKHVPSWIPGAGFRRVAQVMRGDLQRLYDVPFDFVTKQMKLGTATESFTSSYLEERESPGSDGKEIIKAAAASLYSGGADTTPSSLASFILAMTLHPGILARAQAELDLVIGNTFQRLPAFSDRASLPYVNAIVLEILRWNPAVPLGLAHKLTTDDVYRGHFLPKGTVVWANIWTMLHDENIFPDPMVFRPERFLDSNGQLRKLKPYEDPSIIGFGFGRRICPGMFLADNSIFINIAMMLYVFHFSPEKDNDGNDILPNVEYRGFISHPTPFRCNIMPRCDKAITLIRANNSD
ncbi:hypothetical protein QCA50_011908 [Cerrena zonata]|uniref:Cytochrome P450 n=1 Tax=Cerrena zonata TaxID=2478898 RepID=A0AAW0FVZ6_9APHY